MKSDNKLLRFKDSAHIVIEVLTTISTPPNKSNSYYSTNSSLRNESYESNEDKCDFDIIFFFNFCICIVDTSVNVH